MAFGPGRLDPRLLDFRRQLVRRDSGQQDQFSRHRVLHSSGSQWYSQSCNDAEIVANKSIRVGPDPELDLV